MEHAAEPLVSRQEVADYIGVPTSTLAQWAYKGSGPVFYRVGKHAKYRIAEVDQWLHHRRAEPRTAA